MNANKIVIGVIALGLVLFFIWLPTPPIVSPKSGITIIQDATVFDGKEWQNNTDIAFENGLIIAVSDVSKNIHTRYPEAQLVAGSGKFVLPGLIDAHTHSWANALKQAVQYGVTTELDMFTQSAFANPEQAKRSLHSDIQQADLYSAITLITSPNGHGTEYGFEIPTIQSAKQAEDFVKARIEEGADYLKVVYDVKQHRFTSIDQDTLNAVVTAGKAQGKLVVVHIADYTSALHAIQAGADGLVHSFMDKTELSELIALMQQKNSFLISTLSVLGSMTGQSVNQSLIDEFEEYGFSSGEVKSQLTQLMSSQSNTKAYEQALINVKAFADAGITILAGTDAPNPGTAHGISMHNELEQLVKSGLTPTQALRAATSNAAMAFQIEDRGAIKEGLKADLLVLSKDPRIDITHTRAIVNVYKNGFVINKQDANTVAPVVTKAISLSNFEQGLNNEFGYPWIVSTDEMANGKSSASMTLMRESSYLHIEGSIVKDFAYPWAGICSPFTKDFNQGIDVSALTQLNLSAKGTPGEYRLLVFSTFQAMRPIEVTFSVTENWQDIVVPLTSISPELLKSVSAICFSASLEHDKFELDLKDIGMR